MEAIFMYILLFVVSFIQNMAFTFSSRSRASGDPNHHRRAAWGSNGIWFLNQIFLVSVLFKPALEGDWWKVLISGIVYIIATTEGSVFMMKLMLGQSKWKQLERFFKETGKRKVGSS